MEYHFTRMTKIKKSNNIKVDKDMDQPELSYTTGGYKIVHFGKQIVSLVSQAFTNS